MTVRRWRYRSAVAATFVVALANISLFLGVALAQGNLKETVGDECSIANIEQYVAQIEKTYSLRLKVKLKKCAVVAVPWLIEQTKVNNEDTQVTAISLLAMIGSDASSAAPRLIELAQGSQNEDLRILVVGALPKVVSSENLEPIIAILGSTLKDKSKDVQFGSAVALFELYKNGSKQSLSDDSTNSLRQLISKDNVVPILIDAFKDDNTRPTAINTLSGVDKNSVPDLIDTLRDKISILGSTFKDKDPFVRFDSAVSLVELYKNTNRLSIYGAVEILREVISKDVVPNLILTLRDKNQKVRTYAVLTLDKIIGEEALRVALTDALEDKDESVRTTAVYALKGEIVVGRWLSTIQVVKIASLRFFEKNPPKSCANNLANLIVGWKCPRK